MRDIHVIYVDSNSADCWFYTRTRLCSSPNVLHFTSYREFVIGVRSYAYAYLLYGMIVVSRSWSGVMNGELYVWMWM